jgi:hypothetical protein
MLEATRQAAHAQLAAVLQPLSVEERERLAHALEMLRTLFATGGRETALASSRAPAAIEEAQL